MRYSPSQTLLHVHALLSDKSRWARGARARDIYGNNVKPHHPEAVAWSINGALAYFSNDLGMTPVAMLQWLDSYVIHLGLAVVVGAVDEDLACAYYQNVDDVNDERLNHETLLQFLQAAAAELAAQGL